MLWGGEPPQRGVQSTGSPGQTTLHAGDCGGEVVSCLSGGLKGLVDAVVCERLKAVVLSSSLLVSGGDSAPGCGPQGTGPELPAHRPLAIVCVAEGWGQAAGLWERISGPGLASSGTNS